MITSLLIAYGAFSSIMHGSWYEREYIDDVRRTHSLYASRHSLAGIVELDIDTANIVGDSLEVGAPGIHEGFSFMITFKRGHTTNAVPTNLGDLYQDDHHYELGYVLSKHDTTLILYHYDERYVLVQETKYKRVPSGTMSALQFTVNKTLFSGRYNVVDSSGKQRPINGAMPLRFEATRFACTTPRRTTTVSW
ncbi:MAG: hypothetical protein JSS89_01410 [Bacteroidetes bacterium]|nr:hypothetical protein [Bacteroidota bacterium]